jgi:hypothetical protein
MTPRGRRNAVDVHRRGCPAAAPPPVPSSCPLPTCSASAVGFRRLCQLSCRIPLPTRSASAVGCRRRRTRVLVSTAASTCGGGVDRDSHGRDEAARRGTAHPASVSQVSNPPPSMPPHTHLPPFCSMSRSQHRGFSAAAATFYEAHLSMPMTTRANTMTTVRGGHDDNAYADSRNELTHGARARARARAQE